MGEVEYRLTEETESARHITYGICAVDSESGETYAFRNAITEDRNRLSALIGLCNDLKLSLIHLDDVIEDFLHNISS